MIYFIVFIYLALSVIIFLCLFSLIFLLWHQIVTDDAPYIPVPEEVLPQIEKEMGITAGETIYDLGSGDGRVLFHFQKARPEAKYMGIDISYWPYFVAERKRKKTTPDANIRFLRKNIFDHDLSDADRIFVYLLPKLMDKLLPKLEKELKKGTRVVSCDYQFSKKTPLYSVDLGRAGEKFGKKIFVYKF